MISTGIKITRVQSLQKPRWNFRKADWENYQKEIDKVCQHIPANQHNFKRFCKLILKTSKKFIPRGVRKQYIPCWTTNSEELLKKYEETQDQEIAEELLESLLENRKQRWIEVVENMDFRRSSRHAWTLIQKLDPDRKQTASAPQISANEIAKDIKNEAITLPTTSTKSK